MMLAARLAATHARRVLAVATVATVALQSLRRRSTARSFAGGFHAEGAEGGNFEGTRFYPQPDLIDSGVIEAGTIHRVAYSVYGNPNGKAVLFVHGGPGGGTSTALTVASGTGSLDAWSVTSPISMPFTSATGSSLRRR